MKLTVDRTRDALLVIDVQPDFMPGGRLAVAEGDQVVAPIAQLLGRFTTIVATQDWHPAGHKSFASSHGGKKPYDTITLHGAPQTLWPDHCVQGSAGAALHAGLPRDPITMILRKGIHLDVDSYSAFRENFGPGGMRAWTGLAGWLKDRGVARVFLCGLARDFCVRWSAEDAVAAGFEAIFLDDLTRSVFPDAQHVSETTAALEKAGVKLLRSTEVA
jgi:nicotinamidase/pyrazinamidase